MRGQLCSPFLLCYSGLTVALCHQDLRHGLLPDR
ncbi:hypothetical protein PCJ30_22360, partial [Klebsiella pneumoniae]|nr:hypothetical protein [Klebsiella pneumoniae]